MRLIVSAAAIFLGAAIAAAWPSSGVGLYQSTARIDSLAAELQLRQEKIGKDIDKVSSRKFYQMTYVGVPLIAAGVLAKSEDSHFRNLRNDYMPQFSYHLDDYVQYSPAAVMLVMKSFGVESRSSWGRMLTSDAFTAAVLAGTVNLMKESFRVTRPDGSDHRSFPSGHTATAFMTATMLTKEYGYLSPWVGGVAYGVASLTGLSRMANNKHWLSDVLTGAGIGILSTEIGYWLGDLIYKDRGIYVHDSWEDVYDKNRRPSFVSLYLGMNIPLSEYDIDESNEFRTSSGSSVGLEGAWFFRRNFGIGGRMTVSSTNIIVNEENTSDKAVDVAQFCIGPYFSYPVSMRWLAGAKLLCGYAGYPEFEILGRTVPRSGGVCFGSGVSATYLAQEHFGVRFFLDWNLLPPHSSRSVEWINTLTCGISSAIHF